MTSLVLMKLKLQYGIVLVSAMFVVLDKMLGFKELS